MTVCHLTFFFKVQSPVGLEAMKRAVRPCCETLLNVHTSNSLRLLHNKVNEPLNWTE